MRDVDHLIQHILDCSYIKGEVSKQVLINRIAPAPAKSELEQALSDLGHDGKAAFTYV
jgi:hypothetical protein